MRTGLVGFAGLGRRAAAAGVPLALFAVTACGGPQDPGAGPPSDERSISSVDESSRDTGGPGSGPGSVRESGQLPSRDGDSRRSGVVGESAGPGGELGPEDGRVPAQWPEDDVTGSVPRTPPESARGGSLGGSGRGDAVQLTYDARAAGGYTRAIRAAAESWNDRVPEIELRPAGDGTEADIRIVVTKGWPGAAPQGPVLGKGTVFIGGRALAQGYDGIRIVAHEFGHLLGLEDDQPGPCSSLMSGKSPGPRCTDADPDAAEVREVRRKFGAETGGSVR
ncbi:snapalysin family zinc-dependent metalloprotease [Streptomyces sp. HNM0575]|uniref:snapalysin family zinc-dependent metalloprotease n=1 Tax=Streptomyces sp. HNM0575 TaxID=2716338 RepID=UPI00145DB134|nr:snapalysin family zinc-dependent metalloprotease [Streptomyces sp. HNM0575]NLU71344.1 snapalysin family zinc-dependent metalloprotease [Streptomyces sp. HNM0575]